MGGQYSFTDLRDNPGARAPHYGVVPARTEGQERVHSIRRASPPITMPQPIKFPEVLAQDLQDGRVRMVLPLQKIP